MLPEGILTWNSNFYYSFKSKKGVIFLPAFIITGLLIAVLVAVFAAQNSSPVDISLLFWELKKIPLFIIFIGAFAAGAFFTFLISVAREIKSAMRLREMNTANRQLTAEVKRLNEELKKTDGTKKAEV